MYAERKGWEVGDVEVDVDDRVRRVQRAAVASTSPCDLPAELERGAARAAPRDRRQVPGPPGAQPARPRSIDRRPGRARWPALMDLGLAGRACVVTGASRGIGRETARLLCAEGAGVLLVARTEDARRGGRGRVRAGRRREAAPSLALDVTAPDAGERMLAAADRALRPARRARQQRRHRPAARPRRGPRRGLARRLRAQRDGAAAGDAGRRSRRWPSAAGAGSSTSARPPASGPRRHDARVLGRQGGRALALAPLRRPLRAAAASSSTRSAPGPVESELWMEPGRPARPVAPSSPATEPRGGAGRRRRRSARSAASPRSTRSPRRSSSSAPSAPPTSPAPPGRSTAAPSR